MEKELYKFRKEDFIPIKGLIDHAERTSTDPNHLDYSYQAQDALRSTGLLVYNCIIIGGVVVGLAKLLLK